jgi:hypothetical protein
MRLNVGVSLIFMISYSTFISFRPSTQIEFRNFLFIDSYYSPQAIAKLIFSSVSLSPNTPRYISLYPHRRQINWKIILERKFVLYSAAVPSEITPLAALTTK